LIPPPSEILYGVGSTLSLVSSEVSHALLNSMSIPSILTYEYGNPTIQITRPNGTITSFAVDIACSGIYSLISFIVFAVFVTYIIRDKPWKKLAIFLTGVSLIYVLNITRISTILIIGYYSSEETALQLFHLLGGWFLIFVGTLLLLIFAEKIFHTQIFTKKTQNCRDCNPKPETNHKLCLSCGKILKPVTNRIRKIDIIKIAAIFVSVISLLSIQIPVFALTEGPAQIIIQTPTGEQSNTMLLPQIPGYTPTFLYRDKDFEELARQDASLAYIYQPSDKTKDPIWVTIEIGSATSMLHNWEFCLISWQMSRDKSALVTQLDLRDIKIYDNPPMLARYFAFQWKDTNQTQEVLYWFKTAKFMENGTTQQKIVKISLINYPATLQNINEENLKPFASAIVNYWEPITTWTPVAMSLSQNSGYLAIITTMLLLFLIIPYFFENRKQRKANVFAYQKLSKSNRQIIDAIVETGKNMLPTLDAIATTHKNRTGEHIENEKLLHKLMELEKTAIIKRDIANIKDEPIMIWKTQMTTSARHVIGC
jgi:exosortase/archaeosortase family protein